MENGGYGSAQAAPIGSFIVEKYLNDTLRNERLADVNRITGQNMMPKFLVRVQFKADSTRAAGWARLTGDSTRVLRYMDRANRAFLLDTSDGSKSPLYLNIKRTPAIKPLTPRTAAVQTAAPRSDSGSRRKPDSSVIQQRPDTGEPRRQVPPIRKPAEQKGDSTQQ